MYLVKAKRKKIIKEIPARAADFLGKFQPNQWVDLAINVGLAFASLQAFRKEIEVMEYPWGPLKGMPTIKKKIVYDWRSALWGPIAYKLATSPAGTPPVSQITGVAGLALLGLVSATGTEGVEMPAIGPNQEFILTAGKPCPYGYSLMWNAFGFNFCMRTKK